MYSMYVENPFKGSLNLDIIKNFQFLEYIFFQLLLTFSRNYPLLASIQSSFLIRSSVIVLHIHCLNAINYGSLVTHQHRTGQTCPYGKVTKEIRIECFMAYHVYINYLHGFMHDFIINYVNELNPYTTNIEIPYFRVKYGISKVVVYGFNSLT